MSRKNAHHTKQFKLDAINYRKEHPDLTQVECAKNLGIGVSTLARWEAQFRDNDGDIPVIGSGSYASEEEKEIARLKRELRDAQDGQIFPAHIHEDGSENHNRDDCDDHRRDHQNPERTVVFPGIDQ